MKNLNDKLLANKLVINFKNTNRKIATSYVATGNVSLEIFTSNKHYIAKGDKIEYKPLSNKYIIVGNAYAQDVKNNRKLFGNKIFIDISTGEMVIDGSDEKPVRFIMQLQTKETTK